MPNQALSLGFGLPGTDVTGGHGVVGRRTAGHLVPAAPDQPADPAFPKGLTVAGRDGFKTRTVYENGTVLHQDFFASHYAPVWGGPLVAPDNTNQDGPLPESGDGK